MSQQGELIGVDIGGTFTDVVCLGADGQRVAENRGELMLALEPTKFPRLMFLPRGIACECGNPFRVQG